jgi:hypothetical protein
MSKFNLKDKQKSNEYIKLDGKFEVEHETEKGILIKNSKTEEAEWFPINHVKKTGDDIEIAEWLYNKSDLFNGEAEADEE